MENKLIKSLINYGLTGNEAKIYIALLRRLEATPYEIAEDTAIPRATVYLTLQTMKENRLVSSLKKNNVLHYTPENTNTLKTILTEKQKVLEEILPELNSLIDTDKEKPNTRIYIGEGGVKIVLDDILETMESEKLHTLYAASQAEITKYFPKYFPNWLKRRESLGIRSKLILQEKDRAKHAFDPNELRETRFLPDRFPFEATVEIYGKKMAVFSIKGGEMYSIIIESKPAVDIFRQFFLFAWEYANK